MATNSNATWLEDRFQEALVAFEQALDAGQSPSQSEWLARYPEVAERLREFFFDMQGFSNLMSEMKLDPSTASSPVFAPTQPEPPGGFRILKLLGQGSFGEVYLAEDKHLGNRLVAMKTLRPRLDSTERDDKLAALQCDAAALARLPSHPNIVQVYSWVEHHNEPFLVMQYVAGGSLADRLAKEGPLHWQNAARYVADIAEGLQSVHASGILHRDIKPANILWDPVKEEALLTDFGLAAQLSEALTPAGSPHYMAPEVFDGQASKASDVYSLAATMFALMTRTVPFAESPYKRMNQTENGLPNEDPRLRDIPQPLEEVIRSGLLADPGARPTLKQFTQNLRGALNQLLADSIAMSSKEGPTAPVNLQLSVSRQVGPNTFEPVGGSRTATTTFRNMKKVPPTPNRMQLRTGDRVQIEVQANQEGFIAVFNVGPTGDLNLLYPDEPAGRITSSIAANLPIHVGDVQMQLPTGKERLFAVWSRSHAHLDLQQFRDLAEGKTPCVSRQYEATRNMVRIQRAAHVLDPREWHSVVLELDHQS